MTPDLSPEAWTALGGGLAAVCTVVVAWLDGRRQAKRGLEAVEEVRVLAEPTGNGYAEKTLANQERVLEAVGRIEERLILTDKRAERIAAELTAYRESHEAEHHASQVPTQADPPAVETPKPKPTPAKRAARARRS